MDRGTSALKAHMDGCESMEMRQTRRGWLQECLGCEAKTEFKYFIGGNQIAHSLEEASCLCRLCCQPIYPFMATVKELNTDAELVTIDRPFVCCAVGPCKCCCFQEASFTSNGNSLGKIEETCYWCIPTFKVYDHEEKELYILHQPTCCGGMCVNICAEGNPCGKGCCKVSFRVYPADQKDTNGDAPYLGNIIKKPKSAFTEIFTDADAFEVNFPKEASTDQKGLLIGIGLFLNAIFFEGDDSGE